MLNHTKIKWPQIPDNSVIPEIPNLRAYFAYRKRMQWLAERFRGSPIKVPDEQGLPHIRRKILARTP